MLVSLGCSKSFAIYFSANGTLILLRGGKVECWERVWARSKSIETLKTWHRDFVYKIKGTFYEIVGSSTLCNGILYFSFLASYLQTEDYSSSLNINNI